MWPWTWRDRRPAKSSGYTATGMAPLAEDSWNGTTTENIAAVATHEMVDISLSALRLGAREVSIVCLERRHEMPAALEEVEEAEVEGIVLHDGLGPKRILGEGGRVVG